MSFVLLLRESHIVLPGCGELLIACDSALKRGKALLRPKHTPKQSCGYRCPNIQIAPSTILVSRGAMSCHLTGLASDPTMIILSFDRAVMCQLDI
jgi:hypothetical protein